MIHYKVSLNALKSVHGYKYTLMKHPLYWGVIRCWHRLSFEKTTCHESRITALINITFVTRTFLSGHWISLGLFPNWQHHGVPLSGRAPPHHLWRHWRVRGSLDHPLGVLSWHLCCDTWNSVTLRHPLAKEGNLAVLKNDLGAGTLQHACFIPRHMKRNGHWAKRFV